MTTFILAIVAMALTVVSSNILVQYPVMVMLGDLNLADWLTWGAFTYPIAFLITDLTNRAYGVKRARQVVFVGFAFAVVLSLVFADPRIAIASGTAFMIAQMLDVTVFDRLRQSAWWQAPLFSSVIGSAIDTALFFSIAFVSTGLPWVGWAIGDFFAKLFVAGVCLVAFRVLMDKVTPVAKQGA
jgi:uncharacterized PurR-regulated membrane protein YhhQ (DUF165 family)